MKVNDDYRLISLLIGVFCLILIGLYYSALTQLIGYDWNREDYTHSWLIPVLIGYILWDNRKKFFLAKIEPSWMGLALFIPGLAMFWIGELGGEYLTMYLSLTITAVGLCWLAMGWKKLKTILFALLLSIAMYPPPRFLHNKITLKLKLISSEIGVWVLHMYGMSAYREGNVIDLGFTQLQVVDACSGLRYLFPLVIMSLLMAYFFKAAFWKKVVFVLSAIPLTIITNSLRIALTGILFEFWGPVVAEGFFHGFSGWFIFMFGLAVLLIEMWVLGGFQTKNILGVQSRDVENSDGQALMDNSSRAISIKREKGISAQCIVAALLLTATLISNHMIDFRQIPPSSRSFNQFPAQIGKWDGQPEDMEQRFIDTLDLSDYVLVNYRNSEGQLVNFYTAYYESQLKGESIHSPATCLPGSGWIFEKAGTTQIAVRGKGEGTMNVNRAFMVKGDTRQLSYYWFPQRDRILTNAYQLKWFNFMDALTRQRTDGALVRLITPVYPYEQIEAADARLVSFTQEVVPILEDFLPD